MKDRLRQRFKAWRENQDPSWVQEASEKITLSALALPELMAARRVGTYLSVGNEVGTGSLVRILVQRGVAVAVPYAEGDHYGLSWIDARQTMVSGRFGIPEPASPSPVDPSDMEVMVVPGLAFDREGHRLGYGGGHFDRLLSRTEAIRVGFGFEGQVTDQLPREVHDLPMNLVITETCVRRFGEPSTGEEVP
jgi:5-formyltetrahydrofolate cyclo-ligase